MRWKGKFVVNIAILILIANCVSSKNLNSNITSTNNENNRDQIKINNKNVSETSIESRKSEARDTRWSYYYMGRWVWHLPLWFLLYFVWYIVFCTVRSIYNHTVS